MDTGRTKLGLLGRNISYSFSQGYFTEKFKELGLDHLSYKNFDIPEIEEFPFLLYQREDEFIGMNVTIPYKQVVQKYLSYIHPDAEKIGAVNTILVNKDNELEGYNTDVYGFEESLKPLLKPTHKKALILGTGGASKAVAFAFERLGIQYKFVSRKGLSDTVISYADLNKELIEEYTVIVNCTPLGTFPDIDKHPEIPYEYISSDHLLYDLIYNPAETSFLIKGKENGASIKNGLQMLELQADKSWEIWNNGGLK